MTYCRMPGEPAGVIAARLIGVRRVTIGVSTIVTRRLLHSGAPGSLADGGKDGGVMTGAIGGRLRHAVFRLACEGAGRHGANGVRDDGRTGERARCERISRMYSRCTRAYVLSTLVRGDSKTRREEKKRRVHARVVRNGTESCARVLALTSNSPRRGHARLVMRECRERDLGVYALRWVPSGTRRGRR
jgi:hypothetical protein